MPRYCPECGNLNGDFEKNCLACGTALTVPFANIKYTNTKSPAPDITNRPQTMKKVDDNFQTNQARRTRTLGDKLREEKLRKQQAGDYQEDDSGILENNPVVPVISSDDIESLDLEQMAASVGVPQYGNKLTMRKFASSAGSIPRGADTTISPAAVVEQLKNSHKRVKMDDDNSE